jgi:hypothetical protein
MAGIVGWFSAQVTDIFQALRPFADTSWRSRQLKGPAGS